MAASAILVRSEYYEKQHLNALVNIASDLNWVDFPCADEERYRIQLDPMSRRTSATGAKLMMVMEDM